MKKLTINYKLILKYILYFLLFLLLSNATTFSNFRPFSLGLFVALAYTKQNIVLASIMYICSNFIVDFSVESAVMSVVPSLIILGAYFVHGKLKYPISMLYINIYAFVSSMVIFAFVTTDNMINALVSILLGAVFTYCACIVANLVLIRGLKYRINSDEIMAGGVFFAVIGLALYSARIYEFNFYFLVAPFLILLTTYFSSSFTLGLSAVLGLGVTLNTGNILFVATTILWGLVVCIFRKIPYFSGVGIILIDLLVGLYFSSYPTYSFYNIIGLCLAVVLFILLPKKVRRFLTTNFCIESDGIATKNIVNRSRMDVSNKLEFISNVFMDMHYILDSSYKQERTIEEKSKLISKQFTGRMCKNCQKREECEHMLEDDTSALFDKMIYSCLKRGKATILDIPPFVASRCGSVDLILKNINKEIQNYIKREEIEHIQNKNTKTLSDQMKSMSDILNEVGNDISKTVKFDQNNEQKIIDELLMHNVVCYEAIVYQNKEKTEVSLVVREEDINKKILTKIVSKLLKKRMIIKMNSVKNIGQKCALELIEQPNFDVVFGECGVTREDNLVSGDSDLVRRISDDKVIIALSDGMGSGEKANEKSLTTLAMIESFYKAGFNSEVILSMVNKLLTLTSDDDYATLDMVIIDLISGRADFIKMGATDSFIKHNKQFEVVSGSCVPIGIMDDINVNVDSKKLVSGDIVAIVSDGVSDVVDNDRLIELVEEAKTNNPQTIADIITKEAIRVGATDDVSTVVARLFNKVAS